MSSAGFLREPPRPASPSTAGETPRWLAFRDDTPRLLMMTDDDGRLALPRGATPAAAGLPEPVEPPSHHRHQRLAGHRPVGHRANLKARLGLAGHPDRVRKFRCRSACLRPQRRPAAETVASRP